MKRVFIILCCVLALQSCNKDNTKNETINGFEINWSGNLGKKEKNAIRDMISNMVKVEGGTFIMGAQKDSLEYLNYDENALPNESPVHEVTVSDFYINKYEVSQLLWESVTGKTPNDDMQWEEKYGKGDNYPAYRISYNDVETFIGKLNEYTGLYFTLPTEAQWEYAARGGKNANYEFVYAGSNVVSDVAWINSNSSKNSEVGNKNANALGLHDMSGNVWEMCRDWYYDYTDGSVTNPVGEQYNQGYKIFRGGSWYTNAQQARVTTRYRQGIHYRDFSTGFRLVIQ